MLGGGLVIRLSVDRVDSHNHGFCEDEALIHSETCSFPSSFIRESLSSSKEICGRGKPLTDNASGDRLDSN